MTDIKFFNKLELPKRAIYSVYMGNKHIFAPQGESLEEVIHKVRKMKALSGSTEPISINVYTIEDEPGDFFKLDPTDGTPWNPHELKTILSHHGAYGDYITNPKYDNRYTLRMYHRVINLDCTASRILYEFFYVEIITQDATWHIDAMFSYDMLYEPNCHPSKLKFGVPIGGSKQYKTVTSKYSYYNKENEYVITDSDNFAILLPIRIDEPRGSKWISYRYGAEIIYPAPDMNYHLYEPGNNFMSGAGYVVPVDSISYKVPSRPVIPGIDRYYINSRVKFDEDTTFPEDPVYIDAPSIDVAKKNFINALYEKYGVSDFDIDMDIFKVPEGMWFISEYNQKYT